MCDPIHKSDPAPMSLEPPWLALAVNTTWVDIPDGATWLGQDGYRYHHVLDPSDAETLRVILRWVKKRLDGTLDEVWEGQADAIQRWMGAGRENPEEKLAEAFSEAFLGITYGGPGGNYFGFAAPGDGDRAIFRRMQRRVAAPGGGDPIENPDPAIPILAACQYEATYWAIARGFRVENAVDGFKQDATTTIAGSGFGVESSSASMAIFGPNGARWYKADPVTGLKTLPEGAGVVVGSSPTHIFSILRVHQDREHYQVFDTNVSVMRSLNTVLDRRPPPVWPLAQKLKAAAEDLIGDSAGVGKGMTLPIIPDGTITGYGVLPKPPEDLAEQAKFLRRARPIGLVRFALTVRALATDKDRTLADAAGYASMYDQLPDDSVVFISRLLRMYGDDPAANFPISRLLWSLRNTPGLTALQPWWIVYRPESATQEGKALSNGLWREGGRTATLSELAADAGGIVHGVACTVTCVITNDASPAAAPELPSQLGCVRILLQEDQGKSQDLRGLKPNAYKNVAAMLQKKAFDWSYFCNPDAEVFAAGDGLGYFASDAWAPSP